MGALYGSNGRPRLDPLCRLAYYVARSIVVRSMSGTMKLSSEAVLILVSLAGGPKHGYAIQQDIARVAGRRLGPGSLYGAIARLEGMALIEPLIEDGDRRPYRLTSIGAGTLQSELGALRKLWSVGTRRLTRS